MSALPKRLPTESSEEWLVRQIMHCRLEIPTTEFEFHPIRRWRFDIALPDRKLAFEIEGGTWSKGGHVRGLKYEEDCVKYNEALMLSWRVYRVTTDMVKDGRAVALYGWLTERDAVLADMWRETYRELQEGVDGRRKAAAKRRKRADVPVRKSAALRSVRSHSRSEADALKALSSGRARLSRVRSRTAVRSKD